MDRLLKKSGREFRTMMTTLRVTSLEIATHVILVALGVVSGESER